ncbi:hypothetical protein ACO0QE_004174 [Hanseniaspora vineae]
MHTENPYTSQEPQNINKTFTPQMEQKQRAQTFEVSVPLVDDSKEQCNWPFGSMSGELLAECGFFYAPTTTAKDNIQCVFCNVQHGVGATESESKSLRQTVKHILKKHLDESPTCLLSLIKYCTLSNSFLQFYQKDISVQDYQKLQEWTFRDSLISKDTIKELIKVGFLYYLPIDSPTFIESATGKKQHYGRNQALKNNIEDAHLFCVYCNKVFDFTKEKKRITKDPYNFHLQASPKCYFLLSMFSKRKDFFEPVHELKPAKQLESIEILEIEDDVDAGEDAVDDKKKKEEAFQKDSPRLSNTKQTEPENSVPKRTLKEVELLDSNSLDRATEKPTANKKRKLLLGSLTTKIGESLAESSRSDDEYSRESRISIANLDTENKKSLCSNERILKSQASQIQPNPVKISQAKKLVKSSPIKIDFFKNLNSPKKNRLLDSDYSSDTDNDDIEQIDSPGKPNEDHNLISTTESATASPNRTLKRKLMGIPISHDDLHSLSESSEEESDNESTGLIKTNVEVPSPKMKLGEQKVEQIEVSKSSMRQTLDLSSSHNSLTNVKLLPNTRPSGDFGLRVQEDSDEISSRSTNDSLNSEFQSNGRTNTSSQERELNNQQLHKNKLPSPDEKLQQAPIDTKNMDKSLHSKTEAAFDNNESLNKLESQSFPDEDNIIITNFPREQSVTKNVTKSAGLSASITQPQIKIAKTKSPLLNLKNSRLFIEKTASNLSNAIIEPGVVLEEDISPVKMTTNINIDSSPLKSTKQPTRNINATLKNMQKPKPQTTSNRSASLTDEKALAHKSFSVARTSDPVSEKQDKPSSESAECESSAQPNDTDSNLLLFSYLSNLLKHINKNDATLSNDKLGELHYFFQSMPKNEKNMIFEDWLECQYEKLKQDLLHLHKQRLASLASKFSSLVELVATSEESVLLELAKDLKITEPLDV